MHDLMLFFVCILKQWPLKTVFAFVFLKIKEMSMQVHFCHADAISYKMTHSLLLTSNCQRPPPPSNLSKFSFLSECEVILLGLQEQGHQPRRQWCRGGGPRVATGALVVEICRYLEQQDVGYQQYQDTLISEISGQNVHVLLINNIRNTYY